MRVLIPVTFLLVGLTGCFKPQEGRVRPESPPATKPVAVRPITPDMVTPETGHRVCDQVNEELDRESRKQAAPK